MNQIGINTEELKSYINIVNKDAERRDYTIDMEVEDDISELRDIILNVKSNVSFDNLTGRVAECLQNATPDANCISNVKLLTASYIDLYKKFYEFAKSNTAKHETEEILNFLPQLKTAIARLYNNDNVKQYVQIILDEQIFDIAA